MALFMCVISEGFRWKETRRFDRGGVKLNQERNLEGLKNEEKAELEARVGGLGATGF